MNTCPHSQALDEKSQGLLASVQAIDDACCAGIVTERRQSALECKDLCMAESKVEPTGISVPRGVLTKRRDSERRAPRQGQSEGSML